MYEHKFWFSILKYVTLLGLRTYETQSKPALRPISIQSNFLNQIIKMKHVVKGLWIKCHRFGTPCYKQTTRGVKPM